MKLSPEYRLILVAPLAGAWIEMYPPVNNKIQGVVAPLAGAWIEIDVSRKYFA